MAKTCFTIGTIYFKNNEKEKELEYYKKAENIYIINGDNKCANDVHQKMLEMQKGDDLEQEESVEVNKKD